LFSLVLSQTEQLKVLRQAVQLVSKQIPRDEGAGGGGLFFLIRFSFSREHLYLYLLKVPYKVMSHTSYFQVFTFV
jgi:hypothetical protein